MLFIMHPRPPGEAYRDRRLTTNFELWVEIFCVPTCFHVKIPKPCLSICPYPEKRNHPGFVNISSTVVIDTSMERSSRVLQHWNKKKIELFSKKFEIKFWLVPKSWNHLNFVNISPTLVIDTWMERTSRVLQHKNPKIWFFFQNNLKLNFPLYFDLCQRAEIIQVGLNMNLYDDIGNVSSSLRGSPSSY